MAPERVDYFDAQAAVKRLEAAIGKAVIRPAEEKTFEHVVDLGVKAPGPAQAKESLADYVLRRRTELEKQAEELAFLQDVAELIRKHPRYFGDSK